MTKGENDEIEYKITVKTSDIISAGTGKYYYLFKKK